MRPECEPNSLREALTMAVDFDRRALSTSAVGTRRLGLKAGRLRGVAFITLAYITYVALTGGLLVHLTSAIAEVHHSRSDRAESVDNSVASEDLAALSITVDGLKAIDEGCAT